MLYRKLKVLPLAYWMEWSSEKQILECHTKKIKPILNRYGWYKYYKACWFECKLGAFKFIDERHDFEYNLFYNKGNNRVLRQEVMDAIDVLIKNKLFSRKLLKDTKLYNLWCQTKDMEEIVELNRNITRHFLKTQKRRNET